MSTEDSKAGVARLSWLASVVDAYELRCTLESYEVEEIDVHDLALFLPAVVLSGDSRSELEPGIFRKA